MKRCARCVMPQTVPGISFNAQGVCDYCQRYETERYLGQAALGDIVAGAKAKGRPYDCIVPISGGRDSAFVLYTAKAVYDMRVLAVNYDHEFRTAQAWANMKKATQTLNVDFLSVRSKRDIGRKIVQHRIRSCELSGLYGLSQTLCIACSYGYRGVVYRAAEQRKIPLILWGASQAEDTRDMVKKALKAFQKGRARGLKEIAARSRSPRHLGAKLQKRLAEFCLFLQRLEFHVPGDGLLSRDRPILRNPDVQEVRLFDYIPWDREHIKQTITTHLGWEKPADSVSSWRFDCSLHSLINYCYLGLFGCSWDCFGYTNMINAGQIDREEALSQEEEMLRSFARNEPIPRFLQEEIGLTERDVANILANHRRLME